MAHFARLDENNFVTEVIVIDNDNMLDEDGVEQESIGVEFCRSLFGQDTNWKQTSYNSNFRKFYAGVGFQYDGDRDQFIPPRPYDSFIFDEELGNWVPPVDLPEDDGQIDSDGRIIKYYWDEPTKSFVRASE